MRLLKIFMCVGLTVMVLSFCGCSELSIFLTNKNSDDSAQSTTIPYISPITTATTALRLTPTTTTAATTVPTHLAATDKECVPCPDCGGVLVYCDYCKGTLRRPGEMLDPDSGIYRKYTILCNMCPDDPGFNYCKTCNNQLVVPK